MSVRIQEFRTKKEEEFRNIGEIVMQPQDRDFETDKIMGGISDLFVEQAMAEMLIANVNVHKVKKMSISEKPEALASDQYNRRVSEMASNTRHSSHTPEEVSRKFNIGIEKAKETITVTTHRGI